MRRERLAFLGVLPPTAEDFARAAYPALKATLGVKLAEAGTPIPDTFDAMTPEEKAWLVSIVRESMRKSGAP